MRTTTRLLTVAVALTALVLPAAPAAATTVAAPPGLDWVPCVEDPTAECATLRVPVDWARPHGPKLDLALARRRATEPAARIGSLLINPGGPGGSGVDFALFGTGYFSPRLQAQFDLVGFDPRGVARSNPVLCSLDLLMQAPPLVLTSQADFDRVAAYNRSLYQDCRRHTGPLIDHVDTLSTVRDMDAIRAALGESKLTYYGISYGTLLGQQYAETFPHRVRALALDSNMDHSLGTAGFMDTESATVEDSFDEFVAGCARHVECVLHGRDVRALWADLLDRAARGELHDPFDPSVVITPFGLISFVFGGFYGPEWFIIAEILQFLDTGVPPGEAAAGALRHTAPARARSVDGVELAEYSFGIFCQDWELPLRDYPDYARHVRRQERIAPDYRISPLALVGTVGCLGWPAPVNNPQHRLKVSAATPTLLLGNALHDPATAYSWATNAADQLGRQARLLTYEGWGHGIYGRGPCPTDAIDGYLIALQLPAPGARCPAVEPIPPGAGPTGLADAIGPAAPPRWS